jgi:hypothetical protein
MILFAIAYEAVGRWLRRAMLALARPPAHAHRKVPQEFYRFPLF